MNPSAVLLTNMRLRSAGDLIHSVLNGTLAFVESRINDDLHLVPQSISALQQPQRMESLATLLPAFLSPSAEDTIDIAISTLEPIRVGKLPIAGELAFDLKLRGSLMAPVPTGRLILSNIPVVLPAGRLLMTQGTMEFLSDEPWNPALSAKASGWVDHHFVDAIAFGRLTEGRWILRSLDDRLSPQDLTLLLELGALPYAIEGVTQLSLATNFRAYILQTSWDKFSDLVSGAGVFFTSLQYPRTQWGSDRPLSESLNFATDTTALPLKGFDLGFEWGFR